MGVRTVRFCDITGVEADDVVHHELQIDQMRIEIDLVDTEYERLLEALRPFIDAGRVEASIPTAPAVSGSAAGSEFISTGGSGATSGDAVVAPAAAPAPAVSGSVAGAGDGGGRDLLADLTVIAAGRARVKVVEAAASLQQLDPVAYAGWSTPRILVRHLPYVAKPYSADGGRWISTKKIIAARGVARRRQKKAKSGGPGSGLF